MSPIDQHARMRSPADDIVSRVEALLYAADEPLGVSRILKILRRDGEEQAEQDLDEHVVRDACAALESRYLEANSALQVVEVAGGYRIATRPALDPWIRRLRREERETQLSAPALETLAVVAYRQPTTVAEIADIRGVDPTSALRTLREMSLVKVTGRKRTLGRPFTYGTTQKFLETFGLRDLDELPSPEEFQELLEG